MFDSFATHSAPAEATLPWIGNQPGSTEARREKGKFDKQAGSRGEIVFIVGKPRRRTLEVVNCDVFDLVDDGSRGVDLPRERDDVPKVREAHHRVPGIPGGGAQGAQGGQGRGDGRGRGHGGDRTKAEGGDSQGHRGAGWGKQV